MVTLVSLHVVSLEGSFQKPIDDVSEDLLYSSCVIDCSPSMDCKLLEHKSVFSLIHLCVNT